MEKKDIQVSSDEEESIERDQKRWHLINKMTEEEKLAQLEQIMRSKYKEEYEKQMQTFPQTTLQQIQRKFGQSFKQNNIIFDPKNSKQWVVINRIDSTINSQIVIYRVSISYFQLNVSILNLTIPFESDHSLEFLGGGSYGNIYLMNVFGKKYACKNILFEEKDQFNSDHKVKMFSALLQYSISKICSVLKVGLLIEQALGFDLICYSNCIQFFMQCALPVGNNEKVKTQLFENLSLMHSIKLIHNDIKPQNIMFSPTHNRHVFIDFGVSEFITETIGTMNQVQFKGSYFYATVQMKELLNDKEFGLVDLYFNDLTGLNLTLKEIKINDSLSIDSQDSKYDPKNSKEFLEDLILHTKSPSESINFIISLVLMIYCMYTKQSFQGITIQQIQKQLLLEEIFYIELADAVAQIPPSGFIFDFVKKFIYPFLVQKKVNQHVLFQIYKEKHFVPWLKEDIKKSKRFQNRLSEVEKSANYHLIMLSKPASINKFLERLSLKDIWQRQSLFYIFYLDFMSRNCLKGKQHLIKMMNKKIFQHEQNVILLERKAKNHQRINNQCIKEMHYMNLKHIEKIFPKDSIKRLEDLWIICKVLDQFMKLGDVQKVLNIYQFVNKQPLVHTINMQWFRQTFDIFVVLQKSTELKSIQLLQTKITEMKAIQKRIIDGTDDRQSYEQFITKILIKIAQYFLNISKYAHSKNRKKCLQQLQSQVKQVQNEYKRRQDIILSDENTLRIKFMEMKFSIAFLKKDVNEVLKIGEQIIAETNAIERPSRQRRLNRNIANIMADIYLEMGDLPQAKKYLYRDVEFFLNQNYYTSFTQQVARLKIAILEKKLSDAKQHLVQIKRITQKETKQPQFMNLLITISLKYGSKFACSEMCLYIQKQLDNFDAQIHSLSFNQQENIHRYKVLKALGCEDLHFENDPLIQEKMVNYRRASTLALMQKIKQDPGQLSSQEAIQIQNRLIQFLDQAQNLQSYPHPLIQHHFQITFFIIHLNFHELYSSQLQSKHLFELITKIYCFDVSSSALQVWMNWCLFRLRNNDRINEEFGLVLRQILDHVFESERVEQMIKKKWYELVFEYDAYYVRSREQKYEFSIMIISKLIDFIRNHQLQKEYLIFSYQKVCMSFLHLIEKKDHLKLFVQKLLNYPPANYPSYCIFWYLLYKILLSQFMQLDEFDEILYRIIKFVDRLSFQSKIMLQMKLNMLVAERLNFSIKNSWKYANFQDIKVMGHSFTLRRVQKNYRLYLRKHYRSPYSWYESEKEKDYLLNCAVFTLGERAHMYTQHLVDLASEKINRKYERYFLNKHTQVHVTYRNQYLERKNQTSFSND